MLTWSSWIRWLAGSGLAFGLLVPPVPAAGEEAVRVRVTDPSELAAMGFEPGANVYRVVGSGRDAPETPDEFGTDAADFSAYNANQFHGRYSTYAYSCNPCGGAAYHTGGDNFADVQLDMPNGSDFLTLRWWGFDNHVEDLTLYVFRTCLPTAVPGDEEFVILASGGSSGTPGAAVGSISIPGNETVDNSSCTYWARVRFDASSVVLQLYKVRALWQRQVSPAPAMATFGDVPTDHPFFQFVEALSASGITAGCSVAPPLYCPDQPLTRGQMAVFLAKGFGLQWGSPPAAARRRR